MSAPADAPERTGSSAPAPGENTGFPGALVLAAAIAALAGAAAWPIYRAPHVWLLVSVAAAAALAVVWAGHRWRWGGLTVTALLLGCALLVVPLGVPDALGSDLEGLVRGLGDGLAAVALGWKQVLTLTLPLGTYQAVLVPLLVTVYAATALATWLALRGPRTAVWAALPALAAVAFGTLLGPAELSAPLILGPITLVAPRELAVWGAAGVFVACWIGWTSGAARRAALRLGRGSRARSLGLRRSAVGAAVVLVAVAAGAVLAPAVAAPPRTIPRDRIDPVVVVREQTSPLAGYRVWKRDAAFGAPLFRVTSDGALPQRLRLAVLDRSDGVDFAVDAGPGSFTRFPSGSAVADPTRVDVRIEPGYSDIWVPLSSELAAPPAFGGVRAAELADAFYLDRETGAAIAVPTAAGLQAGDSYVAELSAAPDAPLDDTPAADTPRVDLAALPQLDRWLRLQRLPATGPGLLEAIDRLRERGYLSHALSDDADRDWLDALAEEHGTRFIASAGGHSTARIEELFAQLNDQQEASGGTNDSAALVAGVGDDEQFAAAGATIAQALGFDARVVLGVRLAGDEVPGVPACTEVCTGENVAAWIEARGADGVWAPIDVTPQVVAPPSSLDAGERLPEHATVPEERDAPERDPEFGSGMGDSAPPQTASERPTEGGVAILRWVGLSLAALLLVAVAVLFVPAVKALRTLRRRRAATAETRTLAAWEEFIDAHADAGTPALRDVRRAAGSGAITTSRRDLGAGVPGGAAVAAAVDRAVFAPEMQSDADAQEVWAAVDAETARLRSEQTRWQRVRARYRLASFGVGRVRGGTK